MVWNIQKTDGFMLAFTFAWLKIEADGCHLVMKVMTGQFRSIHQGQQHLEGPCLQAAPRMRLHL